MSSSTGKILKDVGFSNLKIFNKWVCGSYQWKKVTANLDHVSHPIIGSDISGQRSDFYDSQLQSLTVLLN